MKLRILFLPLIAVLINVLNAQNIVINDCATNEYNIMLHRAVELQQAFKYCQVDNAPKALRIDWTQTKSNHFEYALNNSDQNAAQPLFFTKARFTARVYLPENHSATFFNFRIIDRYYEIFQFRKPVRKDMKGWVTFHFDVDVSQEYKSSWGGSQNKHRIDLPVKFRGYATDYRTATMDNATNWMAILDTACTILEDKRPADLSVETGHPIRIVDPTKNHKPAIHVKNNTNRTVNATLTYDLLDYKRKKFAEGSAKVTVAPKSTFVHDIKTNDDVFGITYVNCKLVDDDKEIQVKEDSFSFARFKPVGATPGRGKGFLFGVCSHPQRWSREDQEREAFAASEIGVKIMREDVGWGRYQRAEDNWTPESYDFCVDIFAKYGIEQEAIYSYCAPWAVAKDWKPLKPELKRGPRPDYKHWARFIAHFAQRYRGKVHYVEVWNEPDLYGFANFSAEEYIELMKIAYAETKKHAPEMTVLTAGFTTTPPFDRFNDPRHMEKTLTIGRGSYDIHAFHGHGEYRGYKRRINTLLKMRSDLKVDKPWYANETAVPSNWHGEFWQAETLIQKFIFSWARGSIGYNWYDLRNDGFDPKDGEHNFGLITNHFYPKAAYVAYNTLATLLTQATYVQDLFISEDQDLFIFQDRNGDMVIPHWNLDRNNPSRFVLLTNITGKATLVDIFGNESELPVENNALVLNITKTPAFLKIKGQKNIPMTCNFFATVENEPILQNSGNCPEYAMRKNDFFLLPNTSSTLAFDILNPTSSPINATVTLTLPSTIKASSPSIIQVIPAASRKRIAFTLTTTEDFASTNARDIQVAASFGKLWKGNFVVQVNKCHFIESKADKPMFVLNKRIQNTKLVPEAGDLQHLTWNGPNDCSAEIYLTAQGDNILLKAVVKDDKHVQPHKGFDVWNGDNIQFAINTGNRPYFEFGLTRLADGKPEVFIFSAPKNMKPKLTLTTQRDETQKTTTYRAVIPLKEIGMTRETAQKGFLFNILVNDNDDNLREGFMFLAPGIGSGKSARHFPVLKLKP